MGMNLHGLQGPFTISGTVTIAGTVTANQGTAAAAAGAWPMALTTTGDVLVKPGDSVNNAVRVNIVAGAAAGGTSATDEAAATAGSSAFTPLGGVFNDSFANLASGQMGIVRLTNTRAMHVNVDNSVAVTGTFWQATQPVSGTVTANAGTGTFATNIAQINGVTPLMGNGVTGTGSLRVTIASDNTAFTVKAQLQDNAGTAITVGQKAMAASVPVVLASDQSAVPVSFNDSESLAQNLSALNAAVTSTAPSIGTWGFAITGTWSATITFEYTIDGTTWLSMDVFPVGGGSSVQTATANGQWVVPDQGYLQVRARVSAYTSGTAVVSLVGKRADVARAQGQQTSAKSLSVVIASDNTPTVTANQGTANATPWNENLAQVGGAAFAQGQRTSANSLSCVGASDGVFLVVGNVGSGVTNSGNPLQSGGRAATTVPTAVTDGQRVGAMFDKYGRHVTSPHSPRDLVVVQQTTITVNTETTILTAVAATFLDVVSLVITNSSATAVSVTIKDATAGTTRFIIDVAANGGAVINLPVPHPQAAVNNNWTATVSSAVTSIHITAIAVKNT